MFTLVTGIVGRWRAVCVTALQRPNSDAAAIRIVVWIAAASFIVKRMGPERILPNQSEDLGEPQDPPIEWSGGEEEEDEELQSGYQYQPLNQDPEDGAQTETDLQERLQPISMRALPAMRLHLPDPPVDSDDEDDGPAAQNSIPMDAGIYQCGARPLHIKRRCSDTDNDPDRCSVAVWSLESCHTDSSPATNDADHVELVKRTMATVKLPSLSVPVWAQKLSDADWEHLVHQTIQSRSTLSPPSKK
ncbi:unnamed protein product [Ranitomeya imitator]|uniref:Male-enhanced antigen 1 n=1 Tax=Ranitomeya imitator TaxID=111125 RepID=A0ABN9MEF8_9NEOB|nr:unnamed protein product [Ranitomeya imitator]